MEANEPGRPRAGVDLRDGGDHPAPLHGEVAVRPEAPLRQLQPQQLQGAGYGVRAGPLGSVAGSRYVSDFRDAFLYVFASV